MSKSKREFHYFEDKCPSVKYMQTHAFAWFVENIYLLTTYLRCHIAFMLFI